MLSLARMSLLREYAPHLLGLDDALQGDHVSAHAKVALLVPGPVPDFVESPDHDLFQVLVDFILVPHQRLDILDPFKIGDHDAAGVKRLEQEVHALSMVCDQAYQGAVDSLYWPSTDVAQDLREPSCNMWLQLSW